ncbi:AI-2E family transporter [Marinihelvus fidelis]|uniref:AI-2E family transporter n=1 Tax=Marinihelvus fidelis TaxID=2613842 RepID=A0A5N0TEK0_9GAMM|nr:AI-2E family transporter [Marinihelvus fidelis]KAA9133410.1 AI-2E family transporter [Marinihelvus fidelis]
MNSSRGWFILALLVLGGWLLWRLAPVITPFAAAAGIAYLSDPLVDRLETVTIRRWTLGRTLAVVIVFAGLVALFTVALLVIIPALVRQARELVEQMPEYLDWITHTAIPWVSTQLGLEGTLPDTGDMAQLLKDYWKEISGAAVGVMGTLGKGGQAVMGLVTNLVLIPVVAFYLMRDWDRLIAGIQSLLPRSRVNTINTLAREIDEVLGAFIRGQMLVMLGLGVIYSIGLWAIGLQMGFLIGMVAGLLSIVPYLGSFVGMALAVGIALFQFGDILHVVLVLGVFAVGQSLEGMVLTPFLVGDRIGLHPVAVIFAVLAGGQLFGFLGILLALPVAAAGNVIVRHVHDLYQHSAWYRDTGT